MKKVRYAYKVQFYCMIAMILLLAATAIWNKCTAQIQGPVEEGCVFFHDEDPMELSDNFKLITGWAEFSNDQVHITFKKRKREKLNEFIFPVDSTTTNYPILILEMTEQIFWIEPGIRDSGYKYPKIMMLYYTEDEWWLFIILDKMTFHFKGDVS